MRPACRSPAADRSTPAVRRRRSSSLAGNPAEAYRAPRPPACTRANHACAPPVGPARSAWLGWLWPRRSPARRSGCYVRDNVGDPAALRRCAWTDGGASRHASASCTRLRHSFELQHYKPCAAVHPSLLTGSRKTIHVGETWEHHRDIAMPDRVIDGDLNSDIGQEHFHNNMTIMSNTSIFVLFPHIVRNNRSIHDTCHECDK